MDAIQCIDCSAVYKTLQGLEKHVCSSGDCSDCGVHIKNLRRHSCAIRKLNGFDVQEFSINPSHGRLCDACGDWHPMLKNINGFKEWKGIDLCADCYAIEQIEREVRDIGAAVVSHLINRNDVCCAICSRLIICPLTGDRYFRYEFDHCTAAVKIDSVGAMIMKGRPLSMIFDEMAKCRLLCVRCHARVTYAQRQVDTSRLPADHKFRSFPLVESLVHKIVDYDRVRVSRT